MTRKQRSSSPSAPALLRLAEAKVARAKAEAYEEGRKDAIAEFKATRERAWEEARSGAFEQAAKIAESWVKDRYHDGHPSEIARRIRALAKGEGKP